MSVYKRGGSWWFEFYFNGERVRRPAKVRSRRAAETIEAAFRVRLAKGEVGLHDPEPKTLAQFLKSDFLPGIKDKVQPETLRYYGYGCGVLQNSPLGQMDLRDITDKDAAEVAAKLAKRSPSTKNAVLRTLRHALKLAVKWGALAKYPEITLVKGEKTRDRVLTDTEVNRYLSVCEQPWKDAATILLGTGARPGEIFALRWGNISLTDNTLKIVEGKTEAAKRELPLMPEVYEVLKSRWEAQGKPTTGWIFPSDSASGHMMNDTAKNYHGRALVAMNAEKPKVKRFPPYTLRHTALTNLGTVCNNVFVVAAAAGHSNISITKRYVHPRKADLAAAYKQLPPIVTK